MRTRGAAGWGAPARRARGGRVVAILAFPSTPRRAQAAPGADTLPADSIFAQAGPVLRWNVAARLLVERGLTARGNARGRPTFYDGNNNSRLYALVAGAQYDALRGAAADSVAAQAAAVIAAGRVLATVFPRDSAWIARRRDRELAALSSRGLNADARRSADQTGRTAATRWVSEARAELRTPPWSGRVPAGPGRWRGEASAPALALSLNLRPRFLRSRDEFRPPPPPALDSPLFRVQIASVRNATTQRTREQTRATWAWARNAATLWSEIAGRVVLRRHLPEVEAARDLMYLNMALSDATIACWDAKMTYWFPRPSQVDSTIDLSIPLPDFPSYPSAHATLFAAGAAVLGHLVPAEQETLDSLTNEAISSRVWAGVHYPMDNGAGAEMGRRIGALAIAAADAERPLGQRATRPRATP
ncbi:MAG: vanadium-dependent haloperoxidase [Gemmatimonadales bacterium]